MSERSSGAWLTIVGLGEDGLDGLTPAARRALDEADSIFGGPRHLELAAAGSRGAAWPVPFSVAPLLERAGTRVVALTSGDPFWFGAGSVLAEALPRGAWAAHPAPGTFSLLAARLGWRLEDAQCFGLHAAPFARLRPVLHRGARVLVTLRDGDAPAALAQWLRDAGFGATRLVVAEALGGPRERVRTEVADSFDLGDIASPVAVGLEVEGEGLSRASGLPDDLFESDGQITKRPVRALTLSTLAPRAGEHLWDLGAGSGSIGVEWCLAAPGCTVTAVERRADRASNVAANAEAFGCAHRIQVIEGDSLSVLAGLRSPDAVFIGGGATEAVLDAVWQMVPMGTRIVVNGVTLETEALLARWHERRGGQLMQVAISEVEALGSMRGWRPARPITQWSVVA